MTVVVCAEGVDGLMAIIVVSDVTTVDVAVSLSVVATFISAVVSFVSLVVLKGIFVAELVTDAGFSVDGVDCLLARVVISVIVRDDIVVVVVVFKETPSVVATFMAVVVTAANEACVAAIVNVAVAVSEGILDVCASETLVIGVLLISTLSGVLEVSGFVVVYSVSILVVINSVPDTGPVVVSNSELLLVVSSLLLVLS